MPQIPNVDELPQPPVVPVDVPVLASQPRRPGVPGALGPRQLHNRPAAQSIPRMPRTPHLLEAVKVEPIDGPSLPLPNVPGLAQPPRVGKLQMPNLPTPPRVPIGAVRVPTEADVPQGQKVLDGIKVEPLEDRGAGDTVASDVKTQKMRED
ncbi:formin like protein [Aphelenchoides avenae]|nr:formin like protein [Aphelenchus avenae]